jgi:ISXO2-like transposase domain
MVDGSAARVAVDRLASWRYRRYLARKGNVVCQVIEATDALTLQGFVDEAVSDKVDLVATDEAPGYRGLPMRHESVNQSAGQYVRGTVHTANIDGFWSSSSAA